MSAALPADMPLVFMEGPYRLAMGLRALDPAAWFWITDTYEDEIAEKCRLLAERPEEVLAVLPEAAEACSELLDLMIDHLPEHHPEHFTRVEGGIAVHAQGERITRDVREPLRWAGLLVQEDLCLMGAGAEGAYRLTAASLCFPSRWRLADKLGRPLREIHGGVPGFGERLGTPVDRFFSALTVDRPVWRANWSVQDDPELFQPIPKQHMRRVELDGADVGDHLFLRVERQTLRRLPRSGQVLFTIHTMVRPLAEVARLPGAAAALAARIGEMPEPMLGYKNMLGMRPALVGWLERQAAVHAQDPAAALG